MEKHHGMKKDVIEEEEGDKDAECGRAKTTMNRDDRDVVLLRNMFERRKNVLNS